MAKLYDVLTSKYNKTLIYLSVIEYIESTQTCFSKQYQDKNNPYTILTQLANFAINNLTIYKEQTQVSNTQPHTTNTTDSINRLIILIPIGFIFKVLLKNISNYLIK